MVRPNRSMENQQRQAVGVFPNRRSAGRALSETSRVPLSRRSAVGLFSNLSDAEYAVIELRSIGFPLSQITVIANYFRRQDQFTGVELRNRLEVLRWGIPAEQTCFYQDRLGRGKYMVIVNGTEDELKRAASLLNHRGIQEWQVYDSTIKL